MAHSAPNPELDGLRPSLVDEALQIVDFFLGRTIATSARHVKRHPLSHRTAHKLCDRPAGDAPQHIEDREFDPGDRAPQRLPQEFVVAAVAINPDQELLKLARVLANEIGNNILV